MRYFLDTEFFEDGKTIDLISIGIVAEDGRAFYAVNREAELHRVSDWVRTNVLPQLPTFGDPTWMSRKAIATAVKSFTLNGAYELTGPAKPEFWAYYADYDWVVLCQLFGTMMDLPKHFPMFCMDLKQLAVSLGNPSLPTQDAGEHNALHDAHWNRRVHAFLEGLRTTSAQSTPQK